MPTEHFPDTSRRASNRWFAIAVVTTALGALALLGAFVDISGPVGADQSEIAALDTHQSGEIVIVVARTPGGPAEWSNWAVVIQNLAEGIGGPVVVRYLSEGEEAARIIRDEEVDIAFVCAQQFLDMQETGDAIGLCTPVIDGSTTSESMLVVRSESDIESFDDLHGRTVAVSDKSSLGGYAYLQYLCDGRGVVLEDYFSEVRFGDTMESDLGMLKRGEIDSTVINSTQAANLDLDVRVIECSPAYGNPPVMVTDRMSEANQRRVSEVLLSLDVESLLPPDSAIDGFVPFDAARYGFADVLRGVCDDHAHP